MVCRYLKAHMKICRHRHPDIKRVMKRIVIFTLLFCISLLSYGQSYKSSKAAEYSREAEYYQKKADGYMREAEYYKKKATLFIRAK